MFNFESANKRNTVREGIDTKKMEFKPLKDFCGQTVNVDGFFFTNGRFGRQVVVVGNGFLINMPGRATEDFQKWADDTEAVDAILKGKLALTHIKMLDTKNGTTCIYDYVNR